MILIVNSFKFYIKNDYNLNKLVNKISLNKITNEEYLIGFYYYQIGLLYKYNMYVYWLLLY